MICLFVVDESWFKLMSDENMMFSLLLVPLKSVPKRKPNAKQTMDAMMTYVILILLVIDDYYFF